MKPCAIVATLLAALTLCMNANASTVTRVHVELAKIPWQDHPTDVQPERAVLPSGAKHGGAVPASWARASELGPATTCVDGRHASVSGGDTQWETYKIFTEGGKELLDFAYLKVVGGMFEVQSATRHAVAKLAEPSPGLAVWAYREAGDMYLVWAADDGMYDRAVFYGCHMKRERTSPTTGTFSLSSSPEIAETTRRRIVAVAARDGGTVPKMAPWVGLSFVVHGSVSKSSADPEPIVSLLLRSF
jgi:hypothetical protein